MLFNLRDPGYFQALGRNQLSFLYFGLEHCRTWSFGFLNHFALDKMKPLTSTASADQVRSCLFQCLQTPRFESELSCLLLSKVTILYGEAMFRNGLSTFCSEVTALHVLKSSPFEVRKQWEPGKQKHKPTFLSVASHTTPFGAHSENIN